MTIVTASGLTASTSYLIKLMRQQPIDSGSPDTLVSTTSTRSDSGGNLSVNLPYSPPNTYYWAILNTVAYVFAVPATGGPFTIASLVVAPQQVVIQYPVTTVNGHTGPNVVLVLGDLDGTFVTQVNGKTGAITLGASDVGADASGAAAAAQAASVPTTRTINGHALSVNIVLTAADVGADASGAAAAITLAGLGGVPTTRKVNGHALSADITIVGSDISGVVLPTRLVAGHALSADVAIDLDDLSDAVISAPDDGDILTYDSSTSSWQNKTPPASGAPDMVNVADHGIGGTGDIGAALNSLLSSAGSRRFWFPDGVYYTTVPIKIYPGQQFFSSGSSNAVIVPKAGFTGDYVVDLYASHDVLFDGLGIAVATGIPTDIMALVGVSVETYNVEFRNITFDSPLLATPSASNGYFFYIPGYCRNIRWVGCTFNVHDSASYLNGSIIFFGHAQQMGMRAENCQIFWNATVGHAGVQLFDTGAAPIPTWSGLVEAWANAFIQQTGGTLTLPTMAGSNSSLVRSVGNVYTGSAGAWSPAVDNWIN